MSKVTSARISIGLLLCLVIVGVGFPSIAEAHDLIPRPLQEYIQQHPNATPDEIKAFADAQGPDYTQKYKSGEEIIAMAQNQQTTFTDNLLDFLKLGVNHILSGPDHILFVLSLLLVFISIAQTVKLASIFTVGHTLTLLLAGAGLITISPRITEPLIALSIAYVAITTVYFKNKKFVSNPYSKPVSVFFFSLFHGLGFAGLLREIQVPPDKFLSSLFSFNIGIEVGQLIIISLALPFIHLFRNKKWYPLAIKIAAALIASLAVFWVIQRTLYS